jgi:hypothetical protein
MGKMNKHVKYFLSGWIVMACVVAFAYAVCNYDTVAIASGVVIAIGLCYFVGRFMIHGDD